MKTVFAALCLALCASASFAQSGLDSSFGTGGRVTTFFGGDGLNGDDGHSVGGADRREARGRWINNQYYRR